MRSPQGIFDGLITSGDLSVLIPLREFRVDVYKRHSDDISKLGDGRMPFSTCARKKCENYRSCRRPPDSKKTDDDGQFRGFFRLFRLRLLLPLKDFVFYASFYTRCTSVIISCAQPDSYWFMTRRRRSWTSHSWFMSRDFSLSSRVWKPPSCTAYRAESRDTSIY